MILGPCGQCKDDREPCSCAIDTMLKERGQIAVNRERYLVMAKQAKAAQEREPLTPEQLDAVLVSSAKHGAVLEPGKKGQWFKRPEVIAACRAVEHLVDQQPARKPLTEEQAQQFAAVDFWLHSDDVHDGDVVGVVRGVEAAHCIK